MENRFVLLLFINSLLMFFARFSVGVVFYLYNYKQAAFYSFVFSIYYLSFVFLVLLFNHFYHQLSENNFLNSKYKALVKKRKFFSYFKKILKFNFKEYRHFIWYLLQIEVFISVVLFSYTIYWGWGFDLFIIFILSYFYFNLKKYKKTIFLFPVVYYIFYAFVYLTSKKDYNAEGQLIIYILNAVFTMALIFSTQIIIRLGQAIRFVNDENRKEHFKRLSSFDPLTNTYYKYSFLEIMNAKLEHNAEEDTVAQASVLIIELNNLKKINEEYTLYLGNEVLKEIAYILKKYSENYEKYITRWSGNAFLIFIINEDELVVKNYINSIKQDIMKNRFGLKGARIEVSIGVSHTKHFDYQINNLINEAYENLAKEKEIYERKKL